MRKQHYILLWLMIFLLQAACLKDKGNYKYTSLNSISISGIDSAYILNLGDRLKITPLLSFTQDQPEDTANYTYQWVADHTIGFSWTPVTISVSRNLDTTIRLPYIGTYYMYYRVTDKRTKLFQDAYFYLTMSVPSFEGWLLLSDTGDGNSRLSMVSHQGNKDTVYPDILKTVSSAFIPTGAPVMVKTAFSGFPPPGVAALTIFVATSKQFVFLGQDTLEYRPAYDLTKAVPAAVTDWSGMQLNMDFGQEGLLSVNGNVYAANGDVFTSPVNNTPDGQLFPASPWITLNSTSQSLNACVLFDTLHGAFYRYTGSGTTAVPYTNGTLFNFSTGKDLLYMQYVPFNNGEVFAVLQDRSNHKRYLARFMLNGTQHYYGEITGNDISNTTQFAASPNLGYLFYSTGGKVYEYDPVSNQSMLMKDYGSRAISLIKFQQFNFTYSNAGNAQRYLVLSQKLVVCTYNPGAPAGSGMIDIYHVPAANAPLQLYQSFTGGMGKIVSVSYRDR